MACNITAGIARGCRDNKGGVYQFYIASYPAVISVTKGGSEGEITSVTDGSTAVDFFPFIPNKGSSDYTEAYQVSMENGSVGYEQKATMIFSKMEAPKANQIKMMATGDLLIVFKDKNGNYFLMGESDGAALSGGNAGTGKGLTDLNGYSLEITALEGDGATQIDDANIVIDGATGNLTIA